MASALLAASAYDSWTLFDEVSMLTSGLLIVSLPLSISFLAFCKAFLLMCVWVKGPHKNAGKMGLKRASVRSRLSRDKGIPSYFHKSLPLLYIHMWNVQCARCIYKRNRYLMG